MPPLDPAGLPAPHPTPVTAPFWEAARQGRLVLQHCRRCDRLQHYPRPHCVACLDDDLDWVEASGRGTVYSVTVVHRAMHPAYVARVPYAHAIVELAEGPRLTTVMTGCEPGDVRVGMPVRAVFAPVSDDAALVLFAPDDGG